jgi:histone deacetylase 11
LRESAVVARALEVPAARLVPSFLLDRAILRPMRLATQGTIQAVERALEGCVVFNLGGGYHHAFADHGEGFCIYADVAIALTRARRTGCLNATDHILVIDLDAHRGNGTENIFRDDPNVHFFDMYNFQIYPAIRTPRMTI